LGKPFKRLGKGFVELSCHTVMIVLILAAIRAVEWALEILWGTKEKVLFDTIPVRYLFDGADLLLLVAFLCVGGYAVYGAYFED